MSTSQATARPHGFAPGPELRALFRQAQALDDAIEYRKALHQSCPQCGPDETARCDEHARNLELIASYEEASFLARRELSRRVAADVASMRAQRSSATALATS